MESDLNFYLDYCDTSAIQAGVIHANSRWVAEGLRRNARLLASKLRSDRLLSDDPKQKIEIHWPDDGGRGFPIHGFLAHFPESQESSPIKNSRLLEGILNDPRAPVDERKAIEIILSSEHPCGLCWLESDRMRWANQALAELTGLSVEEAGSRNVRSLYKDQQSKECLAQIKRGLRQGRILENHSYIADLNPGDRRKFRSDFILINENQRLVVMYEWIPTSIAQSVLV